MRLHIAPRALLSAGLVALALVALPPSVEARRTPDEALLLTQVCVHEAGARWGDDCPALFEALSTRARSRGYAWHAWARVYSPKIFDRRRPSHRRWIAWLPDDLEQPRHWPYDDSVWDRVRPAIVDTYFRARQVVTGLERSRCEESPDHWGGPQVDRNRIRAGIRSGYWRIVNCGDTANVFLRSRGAR